MIVTCPCGAEVEVTPIAGGWRTSLGDSYARNCAELAAEMARRSPVGGDFNCARLNDLIAGEFSRHR